MNGRNDDRTDAPNADRQARNPTRSTGREAANGQSLGDALGDLIRDVGTLVRKEVELAKAEMRRAIIRLVRDLIFLSLGLVIMSVAIITLIDSLVYGLAEIDGIRLWLAALIVGGGTALIAIAMLLKGANDLRHGGFPLPRTADSLQEDARMVQDKAR